MTSKVRSIITVSFKTLVERHGFRPSEETDAGDTCTTKFISSSFVLTLEKYRHEFYATLSRPNDENRQISLFNLLAYLAQSSGGAPSAEYFADEKRIEERYRKQLAHIADAITRNLAAIERFFDSGDYQQKFADVEKFMMDKYPKLFRRS
jgi:hypothetical protein